MTPPLAHAGHWAAQLLYLAPVVAMVGAIVWAKIRGRGSVEDEEQDVSSAGVRGNEADDVRP
jgi:hypothetical protein